MPKQTQISIAMKNEVGGLCRLCGMLARAEVNIMGLSIEDCTDEGFVRLIVDEPKKAAKTLEAAKIPHRTTESCCWNWRTSRGPCSASRPNWPAPASTSSMPTARPTCTAAVGPSCCGSRTWTGPWPSWRRPRPETDLKTGLDTWGPDTMLRTRMRGRPSE